MLYLSFRPEGEIFYAKIHKISQTACPVGMSNPPRRTSSEGMPSVETTYSSCATDPQRNWVCFIKLNIDFCHSHESGNLFFKCNKKDINDFLQKPQRKIRTYKIG